MIMYTLLNIYRCVGKITILKSKMNRDQLTILYYPQYLILSKKSTCICFNNLNT
jgi:hypothetical protein